MTDATVTVTCVRFYSFGAVDGLEYVPLSAKNVGIKTLTHAACLLTF